MIRHGPVFARYSRMNIKRRVQRNRALLAVICVAAIAPGDAFALVLSRAQSPAQTSASGDQASRIPADQLDSLVAPIALYPDPLLAQTLAASTYPLELMQLQQWLARNPGLKDKALADAVSKQPWDPSVQAMAAVPDVVKWLAEDIQWTTDLGNAFLAQQSDVMNAVQRMRQKAEMKGTLKSTPQQKVETEVVDNKQVIVIEQANPEVVYVPSYNPTVVYGEPLYPYPPIAYPSWGYYATGAAISFGVGVAMGAAWGGGWGWNTGWGHNDINVNNFNNFNRNANINANRAGNINANRSGTWQHNSAHRGGAPYRDRATANRYGGTARGDSLANRQAGARQQVARQGGNVRSGAVGTAGRTGGLGDRAGAGGGNLGNRAGGGLGDRGGAGGGNLGNRPGGGLGDRGGAGGGNLGNRPGGGNLGNRPTQLPSGGDRIGSRDISRGSGGGAFGGGSDRFSGSSARASSSRGSSSMRSGGSRSGGFGGGGGRSRSGGFGGGGGGRSRGGGGGRGGGRR
jgi:uncharacterized protein DUF3300